MATAIFEPQFLIRFFLFGLCLFANQKSFFVLILSLRPQQVQISGIEGIDRSDV